jgi:hypothetical protein
MSRCFRRLSDTNCRKRLAVKEQNPISPEQHEKSKGANTPQTQHHQQLAQPLQHRNTNNQQQDNDITDDVRRKQTVGGHRRQTSDMTSTESSARLHDVLPSGLRNGKRRKRIKTKRLDQQATSAISTRTY